MAWYSVKAQGQVYFTYTYVYIYRYKVHTYLSATWSVIHITIENKNNSSHSQFFFYIS